MKIRRPGHARDPKPDPIWNPVLQSTSLDKRFVPPPARTSPRTPGTLHLPHIVRAAQKYA